MTTSTDFNSVAKGIISDTIRSVIFVDDDLAEPFDLECTPDQIKLSTGVYSSFRKNNCTLALHQFKEEQSWLPSEDFFFKGRDLFIVDWQLNKNEPKYSSTLDILSKAVLRQSLHFVCVYTSTDAKDFADLIYKINAFFSPFQKQQVEEALQQIESKIEELGLDKRDIFDNNIVSLFKELVLYEERRREIIQAIQEQLTSKSSKEFFIEIRKILTSRYLNFASGLCALGFALNNEELNNADQWQYEVSNYVEQNLVVVNHTFILFANKSEVQSDLLYDRFSDAVVNSTENFLTLMGLEMRNLFEESSAFIGKEIDSINELAFFHHRENTHPKDHFYDFLRELWKDQALAFLSHSSIAPKIFQTLDDYKAKKDIDKKVKEFLENSENSSSHIAKLNFYYNHLVVKKASDKIGFGDVFILNDVSGKQQGKFLLSITAHCDCLYPEKIERNFYFVMGIRLDLKKAVEEGDTTWNSYLLLPSKSQVIAVAWRAKPFTIHIGDDLNKLAGDIPVRIQGTDFKLSYHSTIKESYAQRIANQAFSYPLRVGIFYAHNKKASS